MKPPRRERLLVDGEWYILASSLSPLFRKHVLKDNHAFLVSDALGDFPLAFRGEIGYFHRGTRYLSVQELRIHGERPLLLGSHTSEDGSEIVVEMTNADVYRRHRLILPRNTLFLRRSLTLDEDVFYQTLLLHNYHLQPVEVQVEWVLDSDFADVFEVRGHRRPRRGRLHPPELGTHRSRLSYEGLDGVRRECQIELDPPAQAVFPDRIRYQLHLEPGQSLSLHFMARGSETSPSRAHTLDFHLHRDSLRNRMRRWVEGSVQIQTSHDGLNRILHRALRDLGMMISITPQGPVPFAGIPWYSTLFGRDALITALEMLPWKPDLAQGVLKTLAHWQAQDEDDFTDREPGKILHELREGELANLREIPFIPYYGSVDATPLFLILLGEYYRATGDRDLLEHLWEPALRALAWIEDYGDRNGDGFVEYLRRSPKGLKNQGWKDSADAIHHEDGTLAEGAISLVEVQALVYRAYQRMAELFVVRGEREQAHTLLARASGLRRRFNQVFWMPDKGFYCLALDGKGDPCRVITSNGGQALWGGIVDPDRAEAVAQRLLASDLFSGYGIRTLSSRERRYNPMSYHNGSVWPHDNALIAAGLKAYGFHGAVERIFTSIMEAILASPDDRVPELYCGFSRQDPYPPTAYPVACIPQAWASAALFLLLSSLLGLQVDAQTRRVYFQAPQLPPWLDWIEVRRFPCFEGTLDFNVLRARVATSVEVLRKDTDVEVVITR